MSDEDIENKKYKVVKNYSFQVPSFGGIISANSPADLTVSLSMATEIFSLGRINLGISLEFDINKQHCILD